MNFITGSVHIRRRLTASWFGNIRCARLWLTMTTGSASRRSASVKSRPAMIGTPSAAKNPGETVRNCARGSSSPFALRVALRRELEPGTETAGVAPRHDRADRDALHARQLRDAAHRFLVERGDLLRRARRTTSPARSARARCACRSRSAPPAARAASSAACRRRRAARTTRRSA